MASSVPEEELDGIASSSGTAMSGSLAKNETASPTAASVTSSSNVFDLSSISDLLNDPSVKELAMHIAKDPSFRSMAMELKNNIQGTGEEDILKPDAPTYLSSMQKVVDDPQFISMAQMLGKTLMQDPAPASILQDLRSSGQREAKMRQELRLMATLQDIERGGPAMMKKYMEDPVLLGKLADAAGIKIPKGVSLPTDIDDDTTNEGHNGSPLLQAASTGDSELLRSLLSEGVAYAETDSNGRTALHLACGYGQVVSMSLEELEKCSTSCVPVVTVTCAEILLAEGIIVDSLDKLKNTALHYAAAYGAQECVKLLLRYGASVTIQNLEGKTPYEVAKMNNHIEIANLLHAGAFL